MQQGCGHRGRTAGDGLPSLSPALWRPESHPTWSSHLPCHASVCTHAHTHLCTHTFTHTHVQTQAQTLCSANLHHLHMVTHKHAHPACTRILHAPSRELHARSCAHILHPLCTLLVHADSHMCTHPLFWGHSAPRCAQVLVHITHTPIHTSLGTRACTPSLKHTNTPCSALRPITSIGHTAAGQEHMDALAGLTRHQHIPNHPYGDSGLSLQSLVLLASPQNLPGEDVCAPNVQGACVSVHRRVPILLLGCRHIPQTLSRCNEGSEDLCPAAVV